MNCEFHWKKKDGTVGSFEHIIDPPNFCPSKAIALYDKYGPGPVDSLKFWIVALEGKDKGNIGSFKGEQ